MRPFCALRWTVRHFILYIFAFTLLAGATAYSTDYYWNSTNTGGDYWHTNLSQWRTGTSGGTSLSSFSNGDVFHSNGRSVATETSTSTFGQGASVTLVLQGGALDQISIKAIGASTANLPHLISDGGTIASARQNGAVHNLAITNFQARAGITLLSSSADGSDRTLNLNVANLTGSGTVAVSPNSGDARPLNLTFTNADGYTGTFDFDHGIVAFQNPVQSGGALSLSGTARMALDEHLTFTAVSIGGASLGEGTHSFAALNAAFDAFFVDGGTGTITVGEAAEPDPTVAEELGVRPGMRLVRDTIADSSGLTFATGLYGVSMNGQTFQQEGLVSFNGYQYAAYWHISKRPAVARRELPDGDWETIVFNDYGPISHTDVHNVNVIGICADDGTIHLSFDHHVHTLHYRRTIAGVATDPAAHAWTQSLFQATTSILDPALGSIGSVTYPQFFPTPQNKLQFAFRTGSSGNGDWFLYEYSDGTWQRLGMLFSRAGTYSGKTSRSAYPDQFRYDDLGRLHVTWVWREAGTSLLGNHDQQYAYSDDFGRTWHNNAGTQITQMDGSVDVANAISLVTPGVTVLPITYNRGLMNTTTLYVDAQERPHVISYHTPEEAAAGTLDKNLWRYYHHWRDTEGVWHVNELPFHGRKPQVVLSRTGTMHVIYGTTLDANYDTTEAFSYLCIATATEATGWTDWVVQPFVSARGNLGEPLFDEGRWRREEVLSVYVQEGPATPGTAAPLRVLDFLPLKRQRFVAELPYTAVGSTVWEDASFQGTPMTLNTVPFTKGLGVTEESEIAVPLAQKYVRFLCDVGLDDAGGVGTPTVFQVWADGVELFGSGAMSGSSPNQPVDVDVSGRSTLTLIISGAAGEYANWANARLIPVTPPLDVWREASFPGEINPEIIGDDADPDGDGAPNAVEFAFGMAPKEPGEHPLLPEFSQSGGYPVITFRRRTRAEPGVTYEVLESTGLTGWDPVDLETNLVGVPVQLGDGFELVTIRASVPVANEPSLYLRARVLPAPEF